MLISIIVKAGKLLPSFSNPLCTVTNPASKLVLEVDSCTGPRKSRVVGENSFSVLFLLFAEQSWNGLEDLKDTHFRTEQQRYDGMLKAILNYIKRGSLSYRQHFCVQKEIINRT